MERQHTIDFTLPLFKKFLIHIYFKKCVREIIYEYSYSKI